VRLPSRTSPRPPVSKLSGYIVTPGCRAVHVERIILETVDQSDRLACAIVKSRRATLTLTMMALLSAGLVILVGNVVAQQPAKSLKQQLLGTWTFVVTEANQPDGSKMLPFGPKPKGVNIFTEDGHFVQNQIADGIPKFASNSRVTGTSEENRAAVHLSLFGTYTVDEAKKKIIYKVESSTFPNWVGLEQRRPIDSVTADELRHSNLAGSIAGATTVK
jgi:Lipocalin-like domain